MAGVMDAISAASGPIGLGLSLAPFALAPFQKKKKINWNAERAYADSFRPSGYLTPEDLASGEAQRARGVRGATATAGLQRLEAMRRIRARGIDSAPANEATLARVDQGEARGRQAAGDAADEYLSNIRTGNQRFEQNKAMALIGGHLQDTVRGGARADAQQSTFMNSLLDYTPAALGAIDQMHAGKAVKAGRKQYNAATGKIEPVSDRGSYDSTEGESDFSY
jgi:hypothetical protein